MEPDSDIFCQIPQLLFLSDPIAAVVPPALLISDQSSLGNLAKQEASPQRQMTNAEEIVSSRPWYRNRYGVFGFREHINIAAWNSIAHYC